MKICTKCNIQYPDSKRFCKKCGELLKPGSPIVHTQPQAENKVVKNDDSNKPSSNKRLVLKFVLIGASVVVITVITVFVILFFKQKSAWDEAKERNTLTSYQEYMDEYPNGRNVEDAIKNLENIQSTKDDSVARAQAIQDSISKFQKEISRQQDLIQISSDKTCDDSYVDNINGRWAYAIKNIDDFRELVPYYTMKGSEWEGTLEDFYKHQESIGKVFYIIEIKKLNNQKNTNEQLLFDWTEFINNKSTARYFLSHEGGVFSVYHSGISGDVSLIFQSKNKFLFLNREFIRM